MRSYARTAFAESNRGGGRTDSKDGGIRNTFEVVSERPLFKNSCTKAELKTAKKTAHKRLTKQGER